MARREGSGISGWCMTGHCKPSEGSTGCPGEFPTIARCGHDCHPWYQPTDTDPEDEDNLTREAS